MYHCDNTGVERTPNKSQHTKLTPEKKILPRLLPKFELATFRSRVRRFDQQAVPALPVPTLLMHVEEVGAGGTYSLCLQASDVGVRDKGVDAISTHSVC